MFQLKNTSISNKTELVQILNVNLWEKYYKMSLSSKLELAAEISFNDFIYYHLVDLSIYKNSILRGACKGNNKIMIELAIKEKANNWNEGLTGACKRGHMEIIKLMISKGADNYNNGMVKACQYGHLEIVNLMIDNGANSWASD